ncbi:conserved protein of unknown function [Ruminococcaceae bacterium BL-6]|nr:conserved protein of unknown function [Ruminococcaceae bacterium BL-6]
MEWIRRTMTGRYGGDQLMVGILVFYMLLAAVARWTRFFPLLFLAYLLLAWCLFRIFSRNVSQRYEENQFFLKYWNRFLGWFYGQRRNIQDHRIYRYYKCPNCSSRLRVPKKRGRIEITCPVCGRKFIKKT